MSSSTPYHWLLGEQKHFSTNLNVFANSDARNEHLIQVLRNSTFEVFIPFLCKAAKTFGVQVKWQLSDYSNTFEDPRFFTHRQTIFFIDPMNLNIRLLIEILENRLAEIEKMSLAKVYFLVLGTRKENLLFENLINLRSNRACVVFLLEDGEKETYFSERNTDLFGIGLKSEAIQALARRIFYQVLLPSLFDRPKAIVVDLDNTLYSGVLSEDGGNLLGQSEGQSALISTIAGLKQKHQTILAVCTRNDETEVRNLFDSREDLGFQDDIFDFLLASWVPKEQMIDELLRIVNITPNSVIFIDDSPIELLQVSDAIQGILPIEADGSLRIPKLLEKIFDSYSWQDSEVTSHMRISDIKAGVIRRNIFSGSSSQDTLLKLGTSLLFEIDSMDSLNRAVELSIKTNQFNFFQQRFTLEQLKELVEAKLAHVIVVSVKDDMSDSGRIALITFEISDKETFISEFAISCRALGRGLEDEIFFGALSWLCGTSDRSSEIYLKFRETSKNKPCQEWLSSSLDLKANSNIRIPISKVNSFSTKVNLEYRSKS